MEQLPRSKGDLYALNALKHKRATLAAEILNLEAQLRHRRDMLVHVDATLRLLDPSIQIDAIPAKRLPKRIKLFRQGELGRMILDAIRQSPDSTASTADIVTFLLRAGGHGEEARSTVASRVRGNLSYLEKRGKVAKSKNETNVVWSVAK